MKTKQIISNFFNLKNSNSKLTNPFKLSFKLKLIIFLLELNIKFKQFIYNKIYKIRFDILCCSLLPNLGKGKYYTIKRKGNYLDINDNENANKIIRLIPHKEYGLIVEKVIDNKIETRNVLDLRTLSKDIIVDKSNEFTSDIRL